MSKHNPRRYSINYIVLFGFLVCTAITTTTTTTTTIIIITIIIIVIVIIIIIIITIITIIIIIIIIIAIGRKETFYLMTHSTHFIYGYMASDIW